jgi:hypothetical protein
LGTSREFGRFFFDRVYLRRQRSALAEIVQYHLQLHFLDETGRRPLRVQIATLAIRRARGFDQGTRRTDSPGLKWF